MKLEVTLELKSDGVITFTAHWEDDTSLPDLRFILGRLDQFREHLALSMDLKSSGSCATCSCIGVHDDSRPLPTAKGSCLCPDCEGTGVSSENTGKAA